MAPPDAAAAPCSAASTDSLPVPWLSRSACCFRPSKSCADPAPMRGSMAAATLFWPWPCRAPPPSIPPLGPPAKSSSSEDQRSMFSAVAPEGESCPPTGKLGAMSKRPESSMSKGGLGRLLCTAADKELAASMGLGVYGEDSGTDMSENTKAEGIRTHARTHAIVWRKHRGLGNSTRRDSIRSSTCRLRGTPAGSRPVQPPLRPRTRLMTDRLMFGVPSW